MTVLDGVAPAAEDGFRPSKKSASASDIKYAGLTFLPGRTAALTRGHWASPAHSTAVAKDFEPGLRLDPVDFRRFHEDRGDRCRRQPNEGCIRPLPPTPVWHDVGPCGLPYEGFSGEKRQVREMTPGRYGSSGPGSVI